MCEPRRLPAYRRPSELEREFLRVVLREYPAGLAQIETCLIADWDGGFLEVEAASGPPLEHAAQPYDGPTLIFNETSDTFVGFLSLVWTNERGLVRTIEVAAIGDESNAPDRTRAYVEAARGASSARLDYRNAT